MTIPEALVTLNEPVYLLLFISCFCRLSRSSADVVPEVRAGFVGVAMASLLCVIAPQVWGLVPSWTQIVFGLAILFKQWATSETWVFQIPPHLLRGYRKRLKDGYNSSPGDRRQTERRGP